MQVTDDLIRNVVAEVLTNMRSRSALPPSKNGNGHAGAWGVFADADSAITAAVKAQRTFEKRGLDDRRKAVDCVRRICKDQAEQLGREELEETKIGRLVHKIEKLLVCADRVP